MGLSSESPARARSTHNSFFAPNVFQFILVSLLCYAISDEVHAENSWPLKQYKNATVVLKSSEENGSGEIMFETELLTVFNTLKLNASISGDDEDTFDVLSELESAMDDLLSLAPEMLEMELEFDVYATNKTSCQRECAKGNHCCNYDENVGSNQRLSCLQACMVRVSGVSKSECDASCSSDGCTKFGYSLCSDCTDVISSNACSSNGGSSTDTCLAGCRIGRAVHYLTDATIKSAITNCLSESPVDGLCATYGLITTKFGTMPNWDVSRVTDMGGGTWSELWLWSFEGFGGRSTFNADISKWNTEKVTTMRYMFYKASAFDQDIGNWNTEKVTDMRYMFESASAFNQDISSWNTAQVTDMHDMFSETAFNQDIGSWNTEKVTDMGYMFYQASAFNQDIGNWTTAQVTTMNSMFYSGFRDNGNVSSASAFDQDIGRWNTGKVTTMRYMFSYAFAFNQDIGGWDTAQVTTMYSMFYSASAFNQDIGNWNTGKVINMYGMFTSASAFNQDIGRWNTEKVTDMRYIGDENGGMRFMFQSASAFNHDISSWTGSAATSAQTDMFLDATAFQAKFTCTSAITGPASSCAIPKYDQYYILAQSTCESEGYVTILNLNQCRIAGRALSGDASKGFADDQPANGYGNTGSDRTGGCTFHSGNVDNNLQFFPFATGPCGTATFHCVCGAYV